MAKSKKDKKRSKDDKDLERRRKKQAKADEKQAKKDKKHAKKDGGKGKGKGKKDGKKGKGTAGGAAAEHAGAQAQPGTGEQAGDQPAVDATPAEEHAPADQVAVLKLALRDTEAKLVAAEHRLHQVQQQLEDERRALADATDPALAVYEAQEAVVDQAVAETVAEAIVVAVGEQDAQAPTDPSDAAATTLEEAAEALEAALADADAGRASTGSAEGALTPPLPHEGAEDRPNASWTLVRLRKEAERRGITGVSNLPKAALVQRLNG